MKEIKLTQGKVALVDDDDFEWLNQWKWCFDCGYAARNIRNTSGKTKQRRIKMHRQILGLEFGDKKQCDHIDENTLNNSRSNLRVCSQTENIRNRKIFHNNTSKVKGVSFENSSGTWRARISVNGKSRHLGRFSSIDDASNAYREAAIKYHKEFANLGNNCVILDL